MSADLKVLRQRLGADLATHIQPWMSEVRLVDGDALTVVGEPVGGLHVLLEGTLEVRGPDRNNELLYGVVASGALLGEITFLDDGPATASLIATAPCRLLMLDRDTLRRLHDEAPLLAGRLLERLSITMADRLEATNRVVLEHAPQDPPTRRRRLRKLFRQWVSQR